MKGGADSPLVRSAFTGRLIRRHVELPDGGKVHPDEIARAREQRGGSFMGQAAGGPSVVLGPEDLTLKDPAGGQRTYPSLDAALAAAAAIKARDNDRVTLVSPHGYSVEMTRGEWREVKAGGLSFAEWYDRDNPPAVSEAARAAPQQGAQVASEKESAAFFAPQAEQATIYQQQQRQQPPAEEPAAPPAAEPAAPPAAEPAAPPPTLEYILERYGDDPAIGGEHAKAALAQLGNLTAPEIRAAAEAAGVYLKKGGNKQKLLKDLEKRINQRRSAREAVAGKEQARAEAEAEAKELGASPADLEAAAAEVRRADRESVASWNDVLKKARSTLRMYGNQIDFIHLERYEDSGVPGMDVAADEAARMHPELFRDETQYPEAILFRMLKEGNRKPMAEGDVLREAVERLAAMAPGRAAPAAADENDEFDSHVNEAGDLVDESGNVLFSGPPVQVEALDALLARGAPASGALGRWLRKWFTAPGSLPADVFAEKLRRDGRVKAYLQDVRNVEKDLRRAVRQSMGYVTDEETRRMDDALRGDEEALRSLPPPVREVIGRMRDDVDLLSAALIDAGAIEGNLVGVVEENLGVYLTRRYRVFDDPKWSQKVPADVRNQFKAWLRAEREAQGRPATEDELEGLTRALLYNGTAAESPIAFLAQSKLGSKDLSILTRRKDVPAALRALWGEYTDPLVNYANSVGKMAGLLANHLFLTRVREQGLGTYFTSQPTPENYAQIASKGSQVMRPLNGLWTTPEIKRAFEEVYAPAQAGPLLRVYMAMLGATKYAKTVLSHLTHVRNFTSNVGFAVLNGHWRVDKAPAALAALVKDTPEGRAYWRRLLELNVVGESVHANEFRALVSEVLDAKEQDAGAAVGALNERRVLRALRQGGRLAESLYHAEDAIWKVYAFENEKARYARAYPEWSPRQVEERAAQIVRDTYPTYSMVSRAVQSARRLPLVAPFASFPAEVVRTTYHTMRLAAAELRDPRTRAAGAQRLAGVMAATAGTWGLVALARAMADVSPDDEEAMRRFLPPWAANAPLLQLGRDDAGRPRYVNLGYSHPHSYLAEPVIAALRAEDPGAALSEGAQAAARPFADEELLTAALVDVARNRTRDGREVYNPEAPVAEQARAIAAHVGEPFVPGSLTSARRLVMAMSGEAEPRTGRRYVPRDELLASLTGQRVQQLDVRDSLRFHARAFEGAKADAMRLLTGVARRRGVVADADLAEAYRVMEGARRQVYDEMRGDVLAAQRLGLGRRDVFQLLRQATISVEDTHDLLNGRYRPFLPDHNFLADRPRGQPPVGVLTPQEIQRRRQIVRRAAEEMRRGGRLPVPAAP